jgi:hypothetical protein
MECKSEIHYHKEFDRLDLHCFNPERFNNNFKCHKAFACVICKPNQPWEVFKYGFDIGGFKLIGCSPKIRDICKVDHYIGSYHNNIGTFIYDYNNNLLIKSPYIQLSTENNDNIITVFNKLFPLAIFA